jgi:hypothetical protein
LRQVLPVVVTPSRRTGNMNAGMKDITPRRAYSLVQFVPKETHHRSLTPVDIIEL